MLDDAIDFFALAILVLIVVGILLLLTFGIVWLIDPSYFVTDTKCPAGSL